MPQIPEFPDFAVVPRPYGAAVYTVYENQAWGMAADGMGTDSSYVGNLKRAVTRGICKHHNLVVPHYLLEDVLCIP